jgi:dGTPase
MGAHQGIRVIELGSAQQVEAAGIDQNPGTRLLDDEIIRRRRCLIKVELILKAAATAGKHSHPQGGLRGLAAQNFGNPRDGAIGQAKIRRLGAHGNTIALRLIRLKGRLAVMELAPYAVRAETSRGRLVPEPQGGMRGPYQRDRDRIIHSTGFRKLQYKTQVFVNHEGDFYRTRLTHSIEVAQIARSIARALRLDEDLTEAVALAHDLGHPPFGHPGESGLNTALEAFGGFDHNAQSLRIVTLLEARYAAFDGLNLTWETLEGLAKHNGPIIAPTGYTADYDRLHPLDLGTFASAEAQVAALADDIAYHSHDLDDGLRAQLYSFADIETLPLVGDCLSEARALKANLSDARLRHETVRRVLDRLVRDVVEESRSILRRLDPQSPDDVRAAAGMVAAFSPPVAEANRTIKAFLFTHMYRHWRVNRMAAKARRLTAGLAGLFLEDPSLLPDEWGERAGPPGSLRAAETVRDYIAGMTDRYAREEYRRLTDLSVQG